MENRLTGLIAAVLTPLASDGSLNLSQVPPLVDHLERAGVSGLYICGSTGEGVSLTGDERRAVAEAYVSAAQGRVTTIVQVGHNSLAESRSLAAHAASVGADVISATPPSYFKVNSVSSLVECMAEIAGGAPHTPFYYYHIPSLTGVALDMVELLELGGQRIPNLVGMKYTAPTLHEYHACLGSQDGRFDMLWGTDEMLLASLAVGARGAIGSTYNIAAPLYLELMRAFEQGDLAAARRLQLLSIQMIRVLLRYPFFAALKAVLKLQGVDCGGCRQPLPNLTGEQFAALRSDLDKIGFFDGAYPATSVASAAS